MKKEKNKKKVAVATAALAIAVMLAGTFAWQSYTEWVKNHMQSRGYEEGRVTIIEDFKPKPIDENPTITKDVKVMNTSSSDAFVRISFEEMLSKLAADAAVTGYTTPEKATTGFPVIVNPKQFNEPATGYTLVDNSKLVIKNTKGGTVQPFDKSNLKFYVSADDKIGGFYIEREMTKAEFPVDFDFNAIGATVPVISGDWSGTTKVAQKVTGDIAKQVDDTYEVYLNETGDVNKDFRVWGYGVDVEAKKEKDWAGVNAIVTDSSISGGTVTAGVPGSATSAIAGSGISYDLPSITSTVPTDATTEDWYYNTADGYFYYTKVLKTGSTSTSLIQNVKFPDAKTDQTYKVASYNLYVGLEAIPAARSLLVSDSTFGKLTTTPNFSTTNKAWESNGSGWALGKTAVRPSTGSGANDTALIAYYNSLATIVE